MASNNATGIVVSAAEHLGIGFVAALQDWLKSLQYQFTRDARVRK
jgi:hypothetical protein